MICPFCRKETRKTHWNIPECNNENLSQSDFRNYVLNKNYPHITENIIRTLYIEQEKSLVECSKYLLCKYNHLMELCIFFNIPLRNIQDANNTQRVKNIRKQIYIEKYGASNPLSKGTTAYYKRNQTVKSKYGVENVFQLEKVKDQANATMLSIYGKLRIANAQKANETKQNWTAERRQEYIEKLRKSKINMTDEQKSKRYELWLQNAIKPKGEINKFESYVAEILTWLGIQFHFSFYIKGRQFDFRIR